MAAIEELRAELGKEAIQRPGVLVVGAQSAGKSSVLERLTEISFPRGENMCTRFPIVVQLQTDARIDQPVAYVSCDPEFKGAPRLTSMERIKDTITFYSDQNVSNGYKIDDKPIHIRYIRPSGPVMTVVDLPGIPHVDDSDNMFNIHSITTAMVESYVKNENMIVLVVIPANDDFRKSEALHIVQKYDKEGIRTIGVVSKCDLVAPCSADIVQKIRMSRDSDVKLSFGFVAVRNHGPKEEGTDIVKAEKRLFTTHEVLQKLSAHEWGYQTLSKRILELQSCRVNECIPEVRQLIQKRIRESRNSLSMLGHCPASSSECQVVLTSILVDINEHLTEFINGECNDTEINIAGRALHFAEEFADNVRKEVPDLLNDHVRKELVGLIKEASGHTQPNFTGDPIFQKIINKFFFKDNIPEKLPKFINSIGDLMITGFDKAIKSCSLLKRFPGLSVLLLDECCKIVEDTKPRAMDVSNSIINAERTQIFTQNAEYLYCINKVRNDIKKKHKYDAEKKQADKFLKTNSFRCGFYPEVELNREPFHGDLIPQTFIDTYAHLMDMNFSEQIAGNMQLALHVYADIIMKRLFDVIPMVVRSMMVYSTQKTFIVQVQKTFDDENLTDWLKEDQQVQHERMKLLNCLKNMKDAQRKLDSVVRSSNSTY